MLVKTFKRVRLSYGLRYQGEYVSNDSWTKFVMRWVVCHDLGPGLALRQLRVLAAKLLPAIFKKRIPVRFGKPALARVGVLALRCGTLNVQSGQLS